MQENGKKNTKCVYFVWITPVGLRPIWANTQVLWCRPFLAGVRCVCARLFVCALWSRHLCWSTPPPVGSCTALCSSCRIVHTPPGTGRPLRTSLRHTRRSHSRSSRGLQRESTTHTVLFVHAVKHAAHQRAPRSRTPVSLKRGGVALPACRTLLLWLVLMDGKGNISLEMHKHARCRWFLPRCYKLSELPL